MERRRRLAGGNPDQLAKPGTRTAQQNATGRNTFKNSHEEVGAADGPMLHNAPKCSTFFAAAETKCSKVEHLTARNVAGGRKMRVIDFEARAA